MSYDCHRFPLCRRYKENDATVMMQAAIALALMSATADYAAISAHVSGIQDLAENEAHICTCSSRTT